MRNYWIFYDVETGGLGERRDPESGLMVPFPDEVIQIAAASFEVLPDGWHKREIFELKLKFNAELASPKALEMNSYDPKLWQRDAVDPVVAAHAFARFVGQDKHKTKKKISKAGRPYYVARLSGHNVQGFDNEFIIRWMRQARYFLPPDENGNYPKDGNFFAGDLYQANDTLQIAGLWAYLTGVTLKNHKLGTIAEHFGIDTSGAHDALADVIMNARICKAMRDDIALKK
jgi:hypothetical protein